MFHSLYIIGMNKKNPAEVSNICRHIYNWYVVACEVKQLISSLIQQKSHHYE